MALVRAGEFQTGESVKQDGVNIELLVKVQAVLTEIDILKAKADSLQTQIDIMNFPGYDGGDATTTTFTATYDGGDATTTASESIDGGTA